MTTPMTHDRRPKLIVNQSLDFHLLRLQAFLTEDNRCATRGDAFLRRGWCLYRGRVWCREALAYGRDNTIESPVDEMLKRLLDFRFQMESHPDPACWGSVGYTTMRGDVVSMLQQWNPLQPWTR